MGGGENKEFNLRSVTGVIETTAKVTLNGIFSHLNPWHWNVQK